jgi:sialate O-acetylesterase
MYRTFNTAIAIAACLLVAVGQARAEVKVPTIFSDNMVLQRDVPLRVWGQAAAGEKVTVSIGDASASTTADEKGAWAVKLPAMKYTPNQTGVTMTIKAANTITVKNILIGEVWIGSGQSNMEFELQGSIQGKQAIAAADLPNIRLYHVPRTKNWYPKKDVDAAWKVCSPEMSPKFSAVLYYFGKRLHDELKVPIGLINASWGGTAIEPWTATNEKRTHVGIYYNGMIAPLQPFAIRGVAWYQGETNVFASNGFKYYDKTKHLIESWRKTFQNDKLSFHMVQLAPWGGRYGRGQLPALWEAQVASLKIPDTGLVVTTDLVDDIKDIHPRNKLPVGNRLALWALAKDYGRKDLVYSGPLYKSMKIEGDKIRVSFAHVGGGLLARDNKELNEFQIAAADGKFVAAKAVIDGQTVLVSAEGVAAPTNVRFGWRSIANPNLMNQAELPASPFKTDDWQGFTGQ